MQGFSFFLALHNSVCCLTAGMRIVVAVYSKPHAHFTYAALRQVARVAPFCTRQVDQDGRKSKRIHINVFVVEGLELAVVLVHGMRPRQLTGNLTYEINEK